MRSRNPWPTGPFKTILADPPWRFTQALTSSKTRGGLRYSSLSDGEILALPVGELAATDSILLLWTTNAHLPLAFDCVRAWGFEYRSTLTWGKVTADRRPHLGLGYWLRGATEHALLATRGRPRSRFTGPHGATGKSWSTLLLAPRSAHSEKPAQSYAMLEDIGEAPRIELFARSHREGWTAWGDEAPEAVQRVLTEAAP